MRIMLRDDIGSIIAVGDLVTVMYVDRDRGAEQWMHQGRVSAIGRTRIAVQFAGRTKPCHVGNECLRVVKS